VVSRCFAAVLCFSAISLAVAQETQPKIIAVNIDSSDPHIQQILPNLRDEAVKAVEESAKNVRATLILGSAAAPEEEAREHSADFLLTIDLSVRPTVELPPSGAPQNGPATTADVPPFPGAVPSGITHSRCPDLLGSLTFSYTVIALSGKKIKLHESHTLQESEYPMGPQLECLDKLSRRAVESYASTAVKKLKSKKAL
jgi:hypothetical protein